MVFPLLLADTNVSFPGLGIKDLPISRVAFQIGGFPIYWYGICIVLAFAACVGLAMKQAKKFGMTSDDVIDFSLVVIPAAIIGARLYYVAFSWKSFSSDFKKILDIRDGGLAVLGGVLLSFIAVAVFVKIKKLKISTVLDFLVVYIPLGQAIGRWGNFFNQEAFGTNTNLPWGMISESTTAYLKMFCPNLDPNAPVHPTFLYESLATIAIFVALLIIRKRSRQPFTTVAMYAILYGVARFFIEGLRTDSLYIADTGLRTSQVLSAVMVVAGFAIIAIVRFMGLKREVFASEAAGAKDVNITADESSEAGDTSESTDTPESSESSESTDTSDTGEDKNT